MLAALVPIAAAALITREVLSRSYRDDYARRRAVADQVARHELSRFEQAVVDSVRTLADLDHALVGGLVQELEKSGGSLDREGSRWLKERSGSFMRAVGLDVLFLIDGTDTVLAAPHYRDAWGGSEPELARRARRLRGAPYVTREPIVAGDTVKQVLVVESASAVLEGPRQIAVIGGRQLGSDWLRAVRSPGNVEARVVGTDGSLVLGPAGAWDSSVDPIRVPLLGPDGQPVAYLEVIVTGNELDRLLEQVTISALALAGAAMLITMLLAFVVARRMTRDLDRLVEASQAASRGDLDHRVAVSSSDEIGELGQAFNAMMEDLRTSKGRLVIAERIAAWQEIARRLAHEIKNPLTPIQMSMETLRKTYEKKHPSFDEAFEESTSTVLEETARLKRIVTEFSEFARLPKPQVRPCDLNDLVASALALYEGSVAIVKRLDPSLPEIVGDRDQLTQVLLNLIENARDAIANREGGGGAITVITESVGKARVRLVVEDNGPGISRDVRGKLFTPYFTTKQGRGGTGLGLATVHRIVSDHDGRVEVDEASTGGARFVIELPI
ncbi:MAG TPA: ATP-binding protein [Kofleriaceae bacterium]|nr:ATP-binding protein [Kofleriaceae bacterium]